MANETSAKIQLLNVRLSYPRLFVPKAFEEGGKERYEASFLLVPSNPDHNAKIKEIKIAARDLMRVAYGPDFQAKELTGKCFGNGNDKGKIPDGYADMFYIGTAKSDGKPGIANRSAQAILVEGEPETPYAGCYVNASITLWAQNNKFGKRINGNLIAVQFVEDGEAFGQGPIDVGSEFEGLAPADNTPVEGGGDEEWDDDISF